MRRNRTLEGSQCIRLTVPESSVNPLECKRNYNVTSNKCEVGTLAVDGWTVTIGTAMRGLGGAAARPQGLSSLY